MSTVNKFESSWSGHFNRMEVIRKDVNSVVKMRKHLERVWCAMVEGITQNRFTMTDGCCCAFWRGHPLLFVQEGEAINVSRNLPKVYTKYTVNWWSHFPLRVTRLLADWRTVSKPARPPRVPGRVFVNNCGRFLSLSLSPSIPSLNTTSRETARHRQNVLLS